MAREQLVGSPFADQIGDDGRAARVLVACVFDGGTTLTITKRCAKSCLIRSAQAETASSSTRSTTAMLTGSLSSPATTAVEDAVLLFDGVFLLRPELIDQWDLRIFVSVDFEQTIDRALTRSMAMAGSADAAEIERSWRHRYIPSQQLYFATARPTDHADIIVYNDQLHEPTWDIRSARPRNDRGSA
ncbi:hypothetical protein [Actinokineospora sp.]|uniref:hypothetical protein n=1 Tax=Actinokineospora sp. TaxID=1872133 RepID=UPI0040384868